MFRGARRSAGADGKPPSTGGHLAARSVRRICGQVGGTTVAQRPPVSAARALAYSSLLVTSLLSTAVQAAAGGAPGRARALAAEGGERADDGSSAGAPGGQWGVEALGGAPGDRKSGWAEGGSSAERGGDGAPAGPRSAGVCAGEGPAERVEQGAARSAPSVIPARAVVAAIPASPPAPPPVAPEVPTSGAARTRVDLPLQVEVHGQLFFGVSADARQGWERDVALDRARIEVRGRFRQLLTVIEADVSSKTPLKDAFVRLDGPAATRLTAGQFKAPFLERETESAWSLPLVDRGLVDDYVVDRNGLGGRRLGAVGALRPFDGALEVAGGVFQGTVLDGEPRREDYGARVAARPWGWLEAGVSGYRAGGTTGPVRQAGSGFLVLRLGPLAATLEALAGRLSQGPFTAGLGLLEFTLRLPGRLRLTPVAGIEALRLRGPAAGTGSSAVVGAVLGAGSGLKLKVQGERARRPGDTAPANAIAVELATRF